MKASDSFRSRPGGGGSLCVIPGVMEVHVPVHTELFGSLPGGGELFSIVAVVVVLAMLGRWAHHRLGATRPEVAAAHPDELVVDSDALWAELDTEREPTGA